MTTRFSTLAALVVTFASLTLGGCAADAEGPGAGSTESSISEREAAPDLHAEENVKLVDLVNQENANDLRIAVTADAKAAGSERPELTPVPGFAKSEGIEAFEALEAVAPAIGGAKLDVEMPGLRR